MVGFRLPREYIDDMIVRMAHHSTAIEGNTLTQGETKSILLDNMIPRKMELREFYEVSNYREYLAFLMESYRAPITIETIKETQRLLLAHIRDDNGQFKVVQNMVIGADFELTKPYQVPEALKNWSDTLQYRLDIAVTDEDKIRAIMEQHLQFERIHPFADGNGRTGRALIVHSCLQQELAPIIINKDDRGEYMTLLNDGDLNGLYELGFILFNQEKERMILFGHNFR
ncbi:Fic family protein [Veillonella rodentium]|uniref:Protein involved in cell division n=1 Tax=Veillonella rodentium TaxID=248315 RepID=A0A239YGJ4_9FIRM|nr:Fic family protein [Veillonella rodentium]SNV58105.1 Protein involved in cell division [Veillonella rodentium]